MLHIDTFVVITWRIIKINEIIPFKLIFSVKTVHVAEEQSETDIFRKTLFTFRHLGRYKVVKCVTTVYPNVRITEHLIDLNYKINFLEFYEILLLCTAEKIGEDKRLHELKKVEQKKSTAMTELLSASNSRSIRKETSKKRKTKSFGM